MSTITTRTAKGTPLTHVELDANFTNLNTDKLQIGQAQATGTANSVPYLNSSKVLTSGSGLTFDASGNLGVGTSSPGYKLDVAAAAARVRSTSAYSAFLLSSGDPSANTRNWALASNFNAFGDFVLQQSNALGGDPITAGTTRLTLDASGNLGLGTSSPVSKFDVRGAASAGNGTITTQLTYSTRGVVGTSSAHSLGFMTGATEQMYLDLSGNLGLGRTTNANYKTVIRGVGTTSATAGLVVENSVGTEYFYLNDAGNLGLGVTPSGWGTNSAGVATKGLSVSSAQMFGSNGYDAGFGFNVYRKNTGAYYYEGVGGNAGAQLFLQDTSGSKWFSAPSGTAGNAITFTQAMTLDASGNLLVGTTSVASAVSAGGAQVYVNAFGSGQTSFDIGHITGTPTAVPYERFFYNGTAIGSITQSGTTAVLYNTTSDQRLKDNIQNAPEASELIDAIQVRSFDWKSDGSHQRYGFVAQELLTVAPEAVSAPADPEEMMAVDYSKLVPMLIKEVQSLRARVAALENT